MPVVMEIEAPHGSCRIEEFPNIEDFYNSELGKNMNRRMSEEGWNKLGVAERYRYYFGAKKRILSQHAQGIRAFMRQHKKRGKNGRRK